VNERERRLVRRSFGSFRRPSEVGERPGTLTAPGIDRPRPRRRPRPRLVTVQRRASWNCQLRRSAALSKRLRGRTPGAEQHEYRGRRERGRFVLGAGTVPARSRSLPAFPLVSPG
jgi:hypothetical protein